VCVCARARLHLFMQLRCRHEKTQGSCHYEKIHVIIKDRHYEKIHVIIKDQKGMNSLHTVHTVQIPSIQIQAYHSSNKCVSKYHLCGARVFKYYEQPAARIQVNAYSNTRLFKELLEKPGIILESQIEWFFCQQLNICRL
jgi:hypothetical protein